MRQIVVRECKSKACQYLQVEVYSAGHSQDEAKVETECPICTSKMETLSSLEDHLAVWTVFDILKEELTRE